MKKLTIFYCLLTICSVVAADTATMNSFSAGEITPKLGARSDVKLWYSACQELSNFFTDPKGGVKKRSGTYYIPYVDGVEITPGTPGTDEVLGDYPTLRATTDQADPGLTKTTAISDLTDLENMKNNLAGNYYLTGDIDASGTADPGYNSGYGWAQIEIFTGTFDGCGYTISDLYINRNSNNKGLFGVVGYTAGATIANVTLADVDISGGGYYCGALVARAESSDSGDVLIQNCHVTGSITSAGAGMGYYGGLIGIAQRRSGSTSGIIYVYDSSSSCSLDMSNAGYYSYRGGLIGYAYLMVISNCFATGSLTDGDSGDQQIGGFAGSISYSDLSFCYSTGDVEGVDIYAGGFAGAITNCEFDSCSATGDVTGNSAVGGFAGNIESSVASPGSVTDCYAQGDVTATSEAGGFVGKVDDTYTIFTNGYSVGLVTADSAEGGYDGDSAENTTFTACYWDTETSGQATTNGSAVGQETLWLKRKSNFTDAGWDMDTIWYQAYTAAVPEVPDTEITVEIDPRRLVPFVRDAEYSHVIALGDKNISFFEGD